LFRNSFSLGTQLLFGGFKRTLRELLAIIILVKHTERSTAKFECQKGLIMNKI